MTVYARIPMYSERRIGYMTKMTRKSRLNRNKSAFPRFKSKLERLMLSERAVLARKATAGQKYKLLTNANRRINASVGFKSNVRYSNVDITHLPAITASACRQCSYFAKTVT